MRQSFRIKSCSFLIGAEHTLRSPYLPRECLRVRLIRLGRDQPLTKLLHEFVKVVTSICHSNMDFFKLFTCTSYHVPCKYVPWAPSWGKVNQNRDGPNFGAFAPFEKFPAIFQCKYELEPSVYKEAFKIRNSKLNPFYQWVAPPNMCLDDIQVNALNV